MDYIMELSCPSQSPSTSTNRSEEMTDLPQLPAGQLFSSCCPTGQALRRNSVEQHLEKWVEFSDGLPSGAPRGP